MTSETLERRVLGAIQFVDAVTGSRVMETVQVAGDGLLLKRGREGRIVIWKATGLETHTDAFANPPVEPALESMTVALAISEAGTHYLPRRASIRLPRDPNPANANNNSSLFQPITIRLLPSPAALVAASTAIVYLSVRDEDTEAPLAGALVRVLRASDSAVLGRGMSDWRAPVAGEALVAVPGIPVTSFNAGDGGAVMTTQVDVNIEVIFDPDLSPLEELPDPDDLEARRATLRRATVPSQLRWGQRRPLAIEVP
jgi:hypothetical protein